jgi:hypothetical protein
MLQAKSFSSKTTLSAAWHSMKRNSKQKHQSVAGHTTNNITHPSLAP